MNIIFYTQYTTCKGIRLDLLFKYNIIKETMHSMSVCHIAPEKKSGKSLV